MMKELDQFTVEQLEKYSKLEALTFPPSHAQVAALARIALAVKTSKLNSPEIPDGWVPCSERVPNKGQCVSITDGVLVGVWRYRGWWPDFDGNGCASTSDPQLLIKNITHWMPLPAPPAAPTELLEE